MEALIILLFIVLITPIILILSFQYKTMRRFDRLEEDIGQLNDRIAAQSMRSAGAPTQPSPPALVQPPAPPPATRPPVETEPFIRRVPVPPPHPAPPAAPPPPPPPPPAAPAPPPAPELPRAHSAARPALEKFIGENLVSKIGIAILVLAIGFFVKYAIDNDWIGPVGRVGIGLLSGGILVGVAHRLRNSYSAFSSVLVGGGLAIFYFSIALAYHQYHLFGQSTAFVIMVVITAFAVILSLLYGRQELAVIALVGGFAAPFLVSNGSGNYRALFSYLLILNTGLLVIAYYKTWRLMNLLAFVFTTILFASWLATLPDDTSAATYSGGFLFATAFYVLFFFINIAFTIRKGRRFIASDFGILLANTCCYFAAGLYLITEMEWSPYRGLFSASMGIFNLAGSYFLFRRKTVDTNILYLLVGITLSFVSLTAPIQLHGHAITLFWASEMVLLYWLSRKSGIRIIRAAAYLVGFAMLCSLVMDWVNVYGTASDPLPIVFNKGLMTTLFAASCCFALFLLQGQGEGPDPSAKHRMARYLSLVTGSVLFFFGGALEIEHQFSFYFPGTELYALYLVLYGFALLFLITLIADRRWFRTRSYTDWVLAGCLVVYLVLVAEAYQVQAAILEAGKYHAHFIAHWAASLVIVCMFLRLVVRMRTGKTRPYPSPSVVSSWMGIFAVIFLSVEAHLLINSLFYCKTTGLDRIGHIYVRTGLPILWGLCSFAFMWIGMAYKFKPLRVLSLVIFSITLLKLFLFDIRDIPVAGKIAAFFCLGVLLLVVSFMYQRLKKIIIEDEERKNK
ncbi:MAG: DUF2339 domain-containing protein [Bacteroidota bacterium]|nr:DUF2339 domain-containing protein [Bacteroidota bacterium]